MEGEVQKAVGRKSFSDTWFIPERTDDSWVISFPQSVAWNFQNF